MSDRRTDNLKVSMCRRLDGTYEIECGTNFTCDPKVVKEWISTLEHALTWLEDKQGAQP